MTVYWMDRVKVGDDEEYARYRQAAAPLGEALQGSRLLVMDGRREVLEGPDDCNPVDRRAESATSLQSILEQLD